MLISILFILSLFVIVGMYVYIKRLGVLLDKVLDSCDELLKMVDKGIETNKTLLDLVDELNANNLEHTLKKVEENEKHD